MDCKWQGIDINNNELPVIDEYESPLWSCDEGTLYFCWFLEFAGDGWLRNGLIESTVCSYRSRNCASIDGIMLVTKVA